MRPVRLTMQAFGPYAGVEVIDFRDVLKQNLFGIYGPTGSGKSSIFAAITFALFGQTARSGQATENLRSHHSGATLETKVEFIFEVGKERYLIRREPQQERPKQRGGGTTTVASAAWLFDVTDIPVDEITERNTGKVLAEKKVSTVSEKVQSILGYGFDQFRQILLLPQGQFELFLAANTRDRLVILRDLFDVDLYRRLSEKLKEEAGTQRVDLKVKREAAIKQLTSPGYADLEDLAAKIKGSEEELDQLETAQSDMKKIADKAGETLANAKNLEEKFKSLQNTQNRLKELLAKQPEIEEIKNKVQLAQNADKATDLDEAQDRTARDVQEKRKELEGIRKVANDMKARSDQAIATLTRLKEKNQKRKAKEVELSQLEDINNKLANALEQKTEFSKASANVEEKKKDYDSEELAMGKLENQIQTATEDVERAVQRDKELNTLRNDRTVLSLKSQAADQFEKEAKAVKEEAQKVADLTKIWETCREKEDHAKMEFKQAENALSEVQAIHLAEKLIDGEPCPVCGSENHPSPSLGNIESENRDSHFRDTKRAYDAAQKCSVNARAKLKAVKEQQVKQQGNLKAEASPEKSAAEYNEELENLKNRSHKLGGLEKVDAAKARLKNLDQQQKDKRESLNKALDARATAKATYKSAEQQYTNTINTIPEAFRDRAVVSGKITEIKDWIARYDKTLEQAIEEKNDAAVNLATAAANVETAENVFNQSQTLNADAKTKFKERLQKLGLDQVDYARGKELSVQREELKKDVDAHEMTLGSAKDTLKEAEKAIEGKERPDLDTHKTEKNDADEKLEKARKSSAKQSATIGTMVDLQKDVSNQLAKLSQQEEGFQILGLLADEFQGNNTLKMTLETYAIAKMFDDVLKEANRRFEKMTGGRYALVRPQEPAKGNARQGLDIAVHDTHTGKPRPVATLSGGESFMAALSLALGLSDVVQSASGGIHLDTIFIDEGFGTLDSQSLEQTLQALQDLTAGSRTVGLISHVDIVQDAIPFGFQIKTNVHGSQIHERQA